jgi:hypothetical protein
VYRRQVIDFGLSLKDKSSNSGFLDVWLGNFEAFLRRPYWMSAVARVHTGFELPRVFEWE